MSFNYDDLISRYDGSVDDLLLHIQDELSAWTEEYGNDFDGFTAVYGEFTYDEVVFLLAQIPQATSA